MEIMSLLDLMIQHDASDLFITNGHPPSLKINGQLAPIASEPLSEKASRDLVLSTMNDQQKKALERDKESNFGLETAQLGRFRISAFFQRNKIAMVVRRIRSNIPSTDKLGLPSIIEQLALTKRGLILLSGATVSGKSTTLAAMLDYRNHNSTGHILTIEDPIEYDHQHKGCVVTQREVGIDTESYEIALRNALRQAPDVIMIGEVRTLETMDLASTFAETGHLCLSTIHANNANQTLDRIINFFGEERRSQLLMDLSLNLKAVISQRLIAKKNGEGSVLAVEILLNTPLVADLIKKAKISDIKEIMKRSKEIGMKTFDQAVYELYRDGLISYEDALKNADSANEVKLMIKLADRSDFKSELGSDLSLQNIE